MEIKEIRHISVGTLRNLCIAEGWYTLGTDEEYRHLLFDLSEDKKDLKTKDIIEIAEDIYRHSEPNPGWGDEAIECIAFEVARYATVTFTK